MMKKGKRKKKLRKENGRKRQKATKFSETLFLKLYYPN